MAIDLYLPKRLKNEHQHKIVGIVYIILEKILGEKVFANEINSVNIFGAEGLLGADAMPLWMLSGDLGEILQPFVQE